MSILMITPHLKSQKLLLLRDLQQPAFNGQLSTWAAAPVGPSGMRDSSRGWAALS